MADWEMRRPRAGDLELLVEVRAEAMRADLVRLGRYDEHRVRQRLRDSWEPAHAWIIEVAGAFAGSVALRPAEDAHWLEHFFLDPRTQGDGVGTAVLAELLERCDRDGTRVRLIVLRGSAARRLYERHGFVTVDEDPVDVHMLREPRPR
ncbi:GNAT family N-acetyltransferase [Streptomyces sp. NPDC001941]|uniref:GNAT family N-acetyltransferase n=1 Tax=Streptomyces sp. NPDC001941 TaxID=3154659 RepID=UPI00332919B8